MKPRAFLCPHCGASVALVTFHARGSRVTCRNGDIWEHAGELPALPVGELPALSLRLAHRAVLHAYGAPRWPIGTFEDPRDAADAVRTALGEKHPFLGSEKPSGGAIHTVMLVGLDGWWTELDGKNICDVTPATRPPPDVPGPTEDGDLEAALAADPRTGRTRRARSRSPVSDCKPRGTSICHHERMEAFEWEVDAMLGIALSARVMRSGGADWLPWPLTVSSMRFLQSRRVSVRHAFTAKEGPAA